MNKAQARRHRKNERYYKSQFAVTEENKKRKKQKRERERQKAKAEV
jgi:hypothetical protein